MLWVIFNTYWKKKNYPYLYTVAITFMFSSICGVGTGIFATWSAFCYPKLKVIRQYNERCPDIGHVGNLDWSFDSSMVTCFLSIYYMYIYFLVIGHFMFAYRYFEVAEMFGREDKSQAMHLKVRKITSKVRNGVIVLITAYFITLLSIRVIGKGTDILKH
jgi:hypothetical protein